MFKFLKDKLKSAIGSFSKKVDEEGEEKVQEIVEQTPEPPKEAPEKIEKKEKSVEKEQPKKEKPEKSEPKKEVKKEPKEIKKASEKKEKAAELEKTEKKEEKPKEIEKPTPKIKKEKPEIEPIPEKKPEIKEPISEAPEKPEIKEPVPEKEPEVKEKTPKITAEKIPEPEFDDVPKAETKEKVQTEEIKPKRSFFGKLFGKKEDKKEEIEAKKEEAEPPVKEVEQPKEESRSFLSSITKKITTKTISEKQFEDLFWDMELGLLENNVAVEVIEKIKEDLKRSLVDKPISRTKIEETIMSTLKSSINELFIEPTDLFKEIETKKPYIICFVGINGSGKTTTIAKVANMLLKKNKTLVMAAADTFRAAAIDQLEEHANNLGVKIIKHDYGSDPAAVAFDAIKHAEAKNIDVVLIDTAGRLHSNLNLLDEMKKIIRVAKPDKIIFVGEAITGNDCVEQAQQFSEAVPVDGIILSKADIDEKGGASISVSYVTKKPILYLGTGQEYDDIKPFDSQEMIKSLF